MLVILKKLWIFKCVAGCCVLVGSNKYEHIIAVVNAECCVFVELNKYAYIIAVVNKKINQN